MREQVYTHTEQIDNLAVARVLVSQMIDGEVIGAVENALHEAGQAAPSRRLLVDLTQVEFATSPFLSTLIKVHKRLDAEGGGVAVCGAHGDFAGLLRIVQLDRLFPIVDSESEGLRVLAHGAD